MTAPRVVVGADGKFAAVIQAGVAALVDVRDGRTVAEVPLASDSQVAWLGTPSRLLVIAPGPGYQIAQLIDPEPIEPIEDVVSDSQVRIESTMRLAATTDAHALLVGTREVTLLHATLSKLVLSQFHTRQLPTIAGPAGARFVVAIDGMIEEWDPKERAATRRLRLQIPTHNAITALGGGERQFWMVTRDTPSRIDVFVHVNRGQPGAHELPEPISSVASHPQRDLLACIGRDTGRLYVVGLDGRVAGRAVSVNGLDAIDAVAFCPGHTIAMVVARAGKPVMVVGLDGMPLVAAPPAPGSTRIAPRPLSRAVGDGEPVPLASPGTPSSVARSSQSEYHAMLEHYRRAVVAVAERAIGRERDSGRLLVAAEALDQANEDLRVARAGLAERLTPLDLVCREHGIDTISEQVLLHVAAPALWGELALLYGILANDPNRAVCDEQLLWQLLGDTISRPELEHALDPDAPLIRLGLVRTAEGARPFQPLSADPIVVKLIGAADINGE